MVKNYSKECAFCSTSCICNDWTAGLRTVSVSSLSVSTLKKLSYLCIDHLECSKAFFAISNIWLRVECYVILLDLNPVVQKSSIHIYENTISCFCTFLIYSQSYM